MRGLSPNRLSMSSGEPGPRPMRSGRSPSCGQTSQTVDLGGESGLELARQLREQPGQRAVPNLNDINSR